MSGMPSRVWRAWGWKASTLSAQASGVFGVGTEPPPDSTDPSRQVATSDGSPETAPRSAWVICPTFSSRVIRASRPPGRGQRQGDQETGAEGTETDGTEHSPHDGSSRPRPPTRAEGAKRHNGHRLTDGARPEKG